MAWAMLLRNHPGRPALGRLNQRCAPQQWRPPDVGVLRINIDGSVNSSTNEAADRGLIGDSEGRWITGFVRNIGRCSILHAELWAIMDGLSLAWESGARSFEIEVDSSEAVRILNCSPKDHEPSIVRRIRHLLKRQWRVRIYCISRERNVIADSLALLGRSRRLGLDILRQPPIGLQLLLDKDTALMV
ncbi:hypothetical protein F3Y22_tig00110597pilonHSYRG00708 [Hibiscus syriacus]|uniref:RNase H type-1 domain-containing protein n=1 Tax=Hibiscus syriacus TaxID=106335 RepID=A0A6A3A361_HIBSY|nr:hypothetical protein F3Y22_tig00110597pilonHSYRG00708 [Hibiscus syriacus]